MFIITRDAIPSEDSLSVFDSMRATRYKLSISPRVSCRNDICLSVESALAGSSSNGSSVLNYRGLEAVDFMTQLAKFVGTPQNTMIYTFLKMLESRKDHYDNETPF